MQEHGQVSCISDHGEAVELTAPLQVRGSAPSTPKVCMSVKLKPQSVETPSNKICTVSDVGTKWCARTIRPLPVNAFA